LLSSAMAHYLSVLIVDGHLLLRQGLK
jgi:hypothetical protein